MPFCVRISPMAEGAVGVVEADGTESNRIDSRSSDQRQRSEADIDAWANSIEDALRRRKNLTSTTVTIPRVPEALRRGEKDAYEPQIISFGPYHHGEGRLLSMEKYKWRYLEKILARNREVSLRDYIHMIKEQESKIRSYYSDSFDINDDKKKKDIYDDKLFVEMILIDGCFVVEYLLCTSARDSGELDSMMWRRDRLVDDLFLLENQLPFFILNKIYDLATKSTGGNSSNSNSFLEVALNFLKLSVVKIAHFPSPPPESIHHLLHLYHSLCLYSPADREITKINVRQKGRKEDTYITLPGAASLQEAGIRFEVKKEEGSSLDVAFTRGKILMPPFIIDASKKCSFRNLVAFEQLYPESHREFPKSFSVYADFMNDILKAQKDVAVLAEGGILKHILGKDEEVVEFFHRLSRGTSVGVRNYLFDLYNEVDMYRKSRRHRWRANLMHSYLHSPWAIVSVIAGATLLLFALLQTYFSGYSAYHSSSPAAH